MPFVARNRKTGRSRFLRNVKGRRFGGSKKGKFGGMRFKKRNDAIKQNIKGLIIPKAANVKLALGIDFEQVTGTTGPLGFREVWIGNSMVPRCGTGTFGGQVVSAGDNSGVTGAVSGNKIVAGADAWSAFFNDYYSYGSKLSVEVINNSTTSARCVLLAVTDSTPVSQLDALTYEELLSYPGVQKRYLGISTGGNERLIMKGFRKTKNMLGIKDLVDNDDLKMINPATLSLPSAVVTPDHYWYWYFRAIPSNNVDTTVTLSATFKYTGYYKLVEREFVAPTNL